MEEKKVLSRKRFFQVGGLLSASYLLLKHIKFPFTQAAKKSTPVEIRMNDLAVKREKRGTLHG